jgi:phosphoribosylformimino-5-aminoimidazole carboxamide ribotide isomerase
MKIIPAIDIKDGKCTQLVGGVADTAKYYGDPVDAANKWVSLGAEVLHVVDLDAALGTGNNLEKVLEIKKAANVPIHYGGGVRDYGYCEKLIKEYDIDRIAIGTLAIKDYLEKDMDGMLEINNYPKSIRHRIIISLDSRGGKVVTHGWKERTEIDATSLTREFESLVWGFLYTDVDVEGQMRGINLKRTERIIRSTKNPVIASGGISSIKDITDLKNICAWGAVLGKALYEGKIDYKEALKC